MGKTLTYAVELAVGLGCLLAGMAVARGPRLRWLAFVLLAAGASAVVHAIARLLG